jgi:hydroxypyruvate reductase
MPTLLILAPFADFLMRELTQRYRCVMGRTLEERATLTTENLAGVGGMVGNGGSVVDEALLAQLPALEIIAINGVGYDGVNVKACADRKIRVTNTPDVLTDDVADIALALVLMTSRGLVRAADDLRDRRWAEGTSRLTHKVTGKRAGIVGFGRIGKAVARRLAAFEVEVGYFGRRKQEVEQLFFSELAELAAWCDFLIVTCPGGEGTHHLINAEILKALGRTGTLINVARGPVVDEVGLITALEEGWIRGAGLDVFEHEPTVPEALSQRNDVVLLPHVGSATVETRGAMAQLVLDNLDAHFSGRALITPVV